MVSRVQCLAQNGRELYGNHTKHLRQSTDSICRALIARGLANIFPVCYHEWENRPVEMRWCFKGFVQEEMAVTRTGGLPQ